MKKIAASLGVFLLLVTGALPVFAQEAAPTARPQTMLDVQREWLLKNKDRPNHSDAIKPDLTGIKVDTRPCTTGDIMGGMWKMVYFREKPPSDADRFNRKIKHQYLSFNTPTTFARFKSARSVDDEQKARQMMVSNPNPDYAQIYKLTEKDQQAEIMFFSGKTAIGRQSCAIVQKPINLFKPGDMILTGYTMGGKSLMYELYRRWF